MSNQQRFYIDGLWVEPAVPAFRDVINPATEAPAGRIAMGAAADVERAVAAARAAHPVVATGEFGADMQVALVNDGPVTIPLHIA